MIIAFITAEEVEDFTYPGNSINYQGNVNHELNCGVGKSSAVFNQLGKLWNRKKLSVRIKIRFYNSNVPYCSIFSFAIFPERGIMMK